MLQNLCSELYSHLCGELYFACEVQGQDTRIWWDFSCADAPDSRDTSCMASTTLIPVSEYLRTTYHPDCDYVDGELQERNLGESAHSFLQTILVALFHANRSTWKIVAGAEIRVQVGKERYRVPDIGVLRRSDPVDPIVKKAPLICIEVLSPEDRLQRMQERIDDYARMGVEHVWLIDPISRHAWVATADGSHTRVVEAFRVPGTPIRIALAEVFAELDDMLTQC